MNKKKAFTLAETLVTLAIIGVVMALMLRAINRVTPDKEKALFLKTYHAVETVIAEAINNPAYYDQNYYTDAQRGELDADELHMDFRDEPWENAAVVLAGEEQQISKKNAICYFLASSLNTTGTVNCSDEGADNFKTTNGVCFSKWVGTLKDNKYKDGLIKPTCDGSRTVAVRVYRDGKITIPSSSDTKPTIQSAALNWLDTQTDLH